MIKTIASNKFSNLNADLFLVSGKTKTTLSDFKNGCINSCNSGLIIRVIN